MVRVKVKVRARVKVRAGVKARVKTKTKVKIKRRPLGQDQLKFVGKITLWEHDGYADFTDEPLITLFSPAGIEYRERVPYIGCTIHGETERCRTEYLKNERDHGIDDYKVVDAFRYNPQQFRDAKFRGRAVGLDISDFASFQATLEMQFGSACFRSELRCKHSSARSICKP